MNLPYIYNSYPTCYGPSYHVFTIVIPAAMDLRCVNNNCMSLYEPIVY